MDAVAPKIVAVCAPTKHKTLFVIAFAKNPDGQKGTRNRLMAAAAYRDEHGAVTAFSPWAVLTDDLPWDEISKVVPTRDGNAPAVMFEYVTYGAREWEDDDKYAGPIEELVDSVSDEYGVDLMTGFNSKDKYADVFRAMDTVVVPDAVKAAHPAVGLAVKVAMVYPGNPNY